MNYISGQWVEGTGEELRSCNPATGEELWSGKAASETEVNAAMTAARYAFSDWSALPLQTRIGHLESFRSNLEQENENLALTIAKEVGKPLWDAKGEVQAMINKVAISIAAYKQRCGTVKQPSVMALSITRHKPHGVVAVFGPFNFPGHLPNGHIIPALLAGNTVIFKSSEHTPLTAAATLNIWEKAGIPKGVVNLLQGGRQTGKLLSEHIDLNGLFFTGSWPTGKILAAQFAATPDKILALELGGNNPLVVHQVSDIKAAAYTTILSAYLSSGQRCTCARRLIVTEGNELFIQELIKQIQSIKVGLYTDKPEPFMSSVISEDAALKLIKTQTEMVQGGAKVLIEMRHLKEGTGLVLPGLIDVTSLPARSDVEHFGPLLQLIRVPSLNAAIIEANNTAYGLTAGILTDKREDYEHFYDKVLAGVINWNTQLTGASSAAPFGGIGHSGNHRPSAFYAADYCSYPVASLEAETIPMPKEKLPGLG